MPNVRRSVVQLLERWDASSSHAQDLLNAAFERSSIPVKDRALMQHLLFGILRNRRVLALWIDHLRSGKGKGALDDDTRRVLEIERD